MNMLRTVFLLTLLTGILVWAGSLLGGQQGMIVALGIGLAMNFFNYWFSDKLVLAAYHAKVLEPGQGGVIEQDIRELTEKAGMPMPKIAVIPNPAPNAFATGRNPNKAVVAVTEGLLNVCDRREVRAVLAHELGHVRNRDMLTMTLVAGAVSAISVLGYIAMFTGRSRRDNGIGGLLLVLVAPIMATLVQMAISRSREYAADDTGADLSGDPAALADALEALHATIPTQAPLSRTGATAHMMIANPFHGLGQMFSTHPSPQKRIARLRAMADGR